MSDTHKLRRPLPDGSYHLSVSDVVLGALIGLLGGLLVVVLGGLLQRSQDHRRWLRDSRQKLYVQAARELHRAASAAIEFRNEVRDHSPMAVGRISHHVSTIESIQVELDALMLEMQLIGSRRMRRAADETFFDNEAPWMIRHVIGTPLTAENFPEHGILYHEQVDGFVGLGRADLGAIGVTERLADALDAIRFAGRRARHRWGSRGTRPRSDRAGKDEG